MKSTANGTLRFLSFCLVGLWVCTSVLAGAATEPELGSPDFCPSPEHPFGWRGDGSGHFPGANPPLHWGREAKTVKALRSQASKPKSDDTGKPIPDGVIREWLVLGPVPVPKEARDKEVLPNESQLSPEENQKVGDLAWKKAPADVGTLDFQTLFGLALSAQPVVSYAFTRVYSPAATTLNLDMISGHALSFVWLNGKLLSQGSRLPLSLNAGWNDLLVRTACPTSQPEGNHWYVSLQFFGSAGCAMETSNLRWIAQMPSSGVGSPIIVGDKVFVTAAISSLVCVDKNSGRICWVRSNPWADVATPEERQAHAEEFNEIDALNAKMKETDAAFGSEKPPDGAKRSEKWTAENKICKLMMKIDPKYKRHNAYLGAEGGPCVMTPVSDGKYVYVTFANAVVACYDLEGNRKWAILHPGEFDPEHGITCSPGLRNGKLLIYTGTTICGYDTQTGKVLWETPKYAHNGCNASFMNLKIGNADFTIGPDRRLVRLADGKVLSVLPRADILEWAGEYSIPTPVLASENVVCLVRQEHITKTVCVLKVGDVVGDTIKIDLSQASRIENLAKYPTALWCDICSSPLYHDGLIYIITSDAVLIVVDTAKKELVYAKPLDMFWNPWSTCLPCRGGCSSSPTLAGKYIYLFGHMGTTLVLEPGRELKVVARNRIEDPIGAYGTQETMTSCPTFEGNRIYARGEANLYCIEGK